jgi:hypothetical protein
MDSPRNEKPGRVSRPGFAVGGSSRATHIGMMFKFTPARTPQNLNVDGVPAGAPEVSTVTTLYSACRLIPTCSVAL